MTGRPNGTLCVGLTQERGKSLEDKLDRARQSRVESTAGSAFGLDSRLRGKDGVVLSGRRLGLSPGTLLDLCDFLL